MTVRRCCSSRPHAATGLGSPWGRRLQREAPTTRPAVAGPRQIVVNGISLASRQFNPRSPIIRRFRAQNVQQQEFASAQLDDFAKLQDTCKRIFAQKYYTAVN